MSKNANICFYPQLTDEIAEEIKESIEFSFSYLNDEIKEINYKEEKNVFCFDDDYWNIDDFDLNVNIKVSLHNLNRLFGKDGIAPINSKVGLCVEWYSKLSKIRKVINSNDYITSKDDTKNFLFEINLPKLSFNGAISLNCLLYLVEPSNDLLADEEILNNKPGVIIGFLFEKLIFVNGYGSQFPIKTMPLKSNLLWDLQLDLDQPESKYLFEGMTLILNTNHKDYEYINPKSKKYCEKLVNEIVANALTLFFYELSKTNEFDLNDDFDNGTIMAYAKYCKDKMDIQFGSLIDISKSIHEYLEGDE